MKNCTVVQGIGPTSTIAAGLTLAEAKELAVAESFKYDETVRVEQGGYIKYFAQFGTLYAVRAVSK